MSMRATLLGCTLLATLPFAMGAIEIEDLSETDFDIATGLLKMGADSETVLVEFPSKYASGLVRSKLVAQVCAQHAKEDCAEKPLFDAVASMLDEGQQNAAGGKIRLGRVDCKKSTKLCDYYQNEHTGGGAESFVPVMYPAFRLFAKGKSVTYYNPSYAVQVLEQFATQGMDSAIAARKSQIKDAEEAAKAANPTLAVKVMTTGNYAEMFNDVTSNNGAQMAVLYTGPDYTRDDAKVVYFRAAAGMAAAQTQADEAAGLPPLMFAEVNCAAHPVSGLVDPDSYIC
jgi:hypothetical protein